MSGSDRTPESRLGDRDQARQGTWCGGLVNVQVESGASIGGHDRQHLDGASGLVTRHRLAAGQIRSRSQRTLEPRPVAGPGEAGHRGRRDGHDLDVHDSRQAGPHVEQCLYRPQPSFLPDIDVHPDRRGPAGEVASGGRPGAGGNASAVQSGVGRRAEMSVRLDK